MAFTFLVPIIQFHIHVSHRAIHTNYTVSTFYCEEIIVRRKVLDELHISFN